MNRNISNDILSIVRTRPAERTERKKSDDTTEFSSESIDIENEESQELIGILASILDCSDKIVIVINERADVVFVNKMACELLGYSKAELLSLGILDIAPNIDEEILVQSSLAGSKGDGLSTIDAIYKTKSMKPLMVKVEILPIVSGGRYFSLVAKGSSFNKWISDSLSFDERFFMDMVESSPDIIARYDLSYRCIYANEACEKITGCPRSKMIGKFLGQTGFLSKELVKELKHNLRLIAESGLPIEFDLELVHLDTGLPVYLNVVVVVIHNKKNKISGIMAVAHDVTELRHNEEGFPYIKSRVEEGIFKFSLQTECDTPDSASTSPSE